MPKALEKRTFYMQNLLAIGYCSNQTWPNSEPTVMKIPIRCHLVAEKFSMKSFFEISVFICLQIGQKLPEVTSNVGRY